MNYHHESRMLYAAWPLSDTDIESGLIVGWEHVDDENYIMLTPWVSATTGHVDWVDNDAATFMDPQRIPAEYMVNGQVVIGTDLELVVRQVRQAIP